MSGFRKGAPVRRLWVLAVLLAAGCETSDPKPPPLPPAAEVATQHTAWGFEPVRAAGVAGIDRGSVLYWTWNDSILFALWIDQNARAQGKASMVDNKVRFDGAMTDPNGAPVVDISGETGDGKTGSVTINGKRYDLANGRLVLYATAGETVHLRQLKRDPLPKPTGGIGFSALKADPEVQRFFARR